MTLTEVILSEEIDNARQAEVAMNLNNIEKCSVYVCVCAAVFKSETLAKSMAMNIFKRCCYFSSFSLFFVISVCCCTTLCCE